MPLYVHEIKRKMHTRKGSILSTLGLLLTLLRPCVSNGVPELLIDRELQLVAAALRSMCANFREFDIDRLSQGHPLCCLKCSCEPSCTITHSCCPESGYHPTGEVTYTSGRDGMVCRNGVFVGKQQGIFRDPEYEFLEQCPEDTPADVKMNCEDSYTKPNVSLIDSLPLYDTVLGINYANMYCAMCNNASTDDLVPWGPSISCRYTINPSLLTISHFDEMLSISECDVTFEPPDYDVTDTVCFRDVISTCNVTGNWATYDVTVEEFCGVLDMLHVSSDDIFQTYKNIFCAQCNGENVGFNDTYGCPFDTNTDFSTAFTTVLQFSAGDLNQYRDSQREPDTNALGCVGNFAFDPINRRCMPMFCQSPNILDTQLFQCKTLFGNMNRGIASHTFSVLFRDTTNFSEAHSNAQAIIESVLNALDFVCTSTIFYQTNLPFHETVIDALNTTTETITGLFINVQYRFRYRFPHDARNRTSKSIESIFTSTSMYDYMGPETFDAGMIPYIVDVNSVESRDDIVPVNLKDTPNYMFKNPHTNLVIIGEENPWMEICVPNVYNQSTESTEGQELNCFM